MIEPLIIDYCICLIRTANTPYTSKIIGLIHPDKRIYSIAGYFKMFGGYGRKVFSEN